MPNPGHPKDHEIYPIGTVVRLRKTGEFAIVKKQQFLKDGKGFMHYLAVIEGRDPNSQWAIFHTEVDLEALP